MPATILLGALYGDEGKGRVVYELCPRFDWAVRSGGGPNARHTVFHRGRKHSLRHLPCGVFFPKVHCLLGPGMFVDPKGLADELASLQRAGVPARRLRLSSRATVILSEHREEEVSARQRLKERWVETTCSGIGPAAVDKARRIALHLEDLCHPKRIAARLDARADHGAKPLTGSARRRRVRDLFNLGKLLAPRLVDGQDVVASALERNERVFVEGAQGAMLDVDHGTWPHVTATHTGVGGVLSSLGIPASEVEHVVGVARAYATRVAKGSFPTEVHGVEQGMLRGLTGEYQIRLGWLDLVALRAAHRRNGFDELVLTGLDGLNGLDRIRLCQEYRSGRRRWTRSLPPLGEEVRPVYRELAGFRANWEKVRTHSQLPKEAAYFLAEVERSVSIPIRQFSCHRTGPLLRRNPAPATIHEQSAHKSRRRP